MGGARAGHADVVEVLHPACAEIWHSPCARVHTETGHPCLPLRTHPILAAHPALIAHPSLSAHASLAAHPIAHPTSTRLEMLLLPRARPHIRHRTHIPRPGRTHHVHPHPALLTHDTSLLTHPSRLVVHPGVGLMVHPRWTHAHPSARRAHAHPRHPVPMPDVHPALTNIHPAHPSAGHVRDWAHTPSVHPRYRAHPSSDRGSGTHTRTRCGRWAHRSSPSDAWRAHCSSHVCLSSRGTADHPEPRCPISHHPDRGRLCTRSWIRPRAPSGAPATSDRESLACAGV